MAKSSWGSKRQKSKGIWELRYRVGGKQRSQTFRGTAKEADRELAALRMLHEGAEDATGDTTLDAFFWGVFVPECRERVAAGAGGEVKAMSPTTFSSYIRYYENTIQETFGSTALRDVTARAVQAWLKTMTAGSAKHAKAVLKVVMNRAEDLEYVDSHPLRKRYVMPTARSSRQRTRDVYDAGELAQIARECEGEWWEPYYILAAFGGAQRAEAIGIWAREVHWAEYGGALWAVAPVSRGVHRIDGRVEVVDRPKNDYRADPLIVPPPWSLRLKEWCDASEGKWIVDDGFGGPLDPEAVTRAYQRWLQRSSHRYIPFGNLRNSYSTMLHSMGLEDSLVSKLMRHANLTTDYRHYNRISPEAKIGLLSGALGADGPVSGGSCPSTPSVRPAPPGETSAIFKGRPSLNIP